MKKLELFVHSAHSADPKLVSIGENALVAELIDKLHETGVFQRRDGEEILLFLDNQDEPLDQRHCLCDSGVGNRHLLHCHSCKRIKVTVHYNSLSHDRPFSPAARISRILKWATGAFGLTGVDAQGLELRLSCRESEALASDSHIGCYTRPGGCAVDVCLAPKIRVEG